MAKEKVSRMMRSPKFTRALTKGTAVRVYMGAGWEKGYVDSWSTDRVCVKLARGGKNVVCSDARNLETT